MKHRTLVTSVLIASLGLSAVPSFAQTPRQDAREARQDMREAQRDLRRADNPRDAREARRDLRHAQRYLREALEARDARREARYYYNARGPEFRRGGRLPPELRNRHYVVNDWRGHHLAPPPRGYQWVQVGPDYVLAAIATGVIVNLILNQ
jgi:Ni/Co efflux regulator RcnB